VVQRYKEDSINWLQTRYFKAEFFTAETIAKDAMIEAPRAGVESREGASPPQPTVADVGYRSKFTVASHSSLRQHGALVYKTNVASSKSSCDCELTRLGFVEPKLLL